MRTFVVALTLLLLALPAQAQQAGIPKLQNDGPMKDAPKPKADDKAYSRALGTVPTKKYDPGSGMR